jgi:tetratricopeptide (TPR) repeat protein
MKMHVFLVAILLACAAVVCCAQTANISDWLGLIGKKECAQAKALCTLFVGSENLNEKVEAQKCLANVALCGHDILSLEGNEVGGGSMHGSYTQEAVDEALAHLNTGIKLAPQDLTIHMGRLHILEVSGRYQEMVKALDESCTLYQGNETPKPWLAYAPELADLGQLSAGVEFMKVLDKHYPKNGDIVSNIGAFLSMQKKFNEAIPYLQNAVELAPNDSLNAWDLGHAYDASDQVDLADKWYRKALALPPDQDMPTEVHCLYAEFVEKKLKDRPRACTLEKASCEKDKQTACVPVTSAPVAAH